MNRRIFAALACAPLLLSSCKDLTPPKPEPVALAVSPGVLSMSSSAPTARLYVTTTPVGVADWQVSSKPEWLTLSASSGRVNRQPVEVTATADFSRAEPGTYTGRIEFVSAGGTAAVDVTASVAPNPIATLSTTTVLFPPGADSTRVTLTNTGRGQLTWSATGLPSWLTLRPMQGALASGQSVLLSASVNRTPLPGGTTTGSFTLQNNSAAGSLTVPVSVEEPATAQAQASTSLLRYPSGVTEQTFVLRNLGKGPLEWSTTASAAWFSATPASGTVPAGGSTSVRVTVNRAMLSGTQTGALTVRSNSTGGDLNVAVTASTATGLSGLTVLNHGVADAEYSPESGYLAMVTGTPGNALHVIDPEYGTVRSVALPAGPGCVSIDPSGRYAAVCHDGAISWVDLAQARVVRTYPVATNALDAVAGNGWVYVFPRHGQWVSVHNLNVSTGAVTTTGMIYSGMLGRLHPSGRWMYGGEQNLSPSDFEKFDVRSGAALPMYDGPYHGHYQTGGELWFSEEGSRLFARSGQVFRSSEVVSEDMLYMGSLQTAVRSVAHSSEAQRVFALGYASPSAVRVYGDDLFGFRGTEPLPPFTSGGQTVSSTGEYVFVNATGTRVFVLVRAGDTQQWGLAVLNVSSMP